MIHRGFTSEDPDNWLYQEERQIEEKLEPEMLHDACLLCSEDKPHHCHRRLVAEYLKDRWGDVEIEHLGEKRQSGRSATKSQVCNTRTDFASVVLPPQERRRPTPLGKRASCPQPT